jgi:4-hydroxythreonine-4-phosphate dehydrogenase
VSTKPIIGISMGDPAGVGPEIIAKALARREVHEMCCPIVIGSAEVIRQAVRITGVQLEVRATSAANAIGVANVWELGNVDVKQLELGRFRRWRGTRRSKQCE